MKTEGGVAFGVNMVRIHFFLENFDFLLWHPKE